MQSHYAESFLEAWEQIKHMDDEFDELQILGQATGDYWELDQLKAKISKILRRQTEKFQVLKARTSVSQILDVF